MLQVFCFVRQTTVDNGHLRRDASQARYWLASIRQFQRRDLQEKLQRQQSS